jgi:tetratricopeptide (TPR) repeat protein
MRVLAGICLMATFLLGQDPSKLTPEARSFIEAHFLAARQAEADADFAKAIDEYGQIVKRYPKLVPPVYQNLGLVYYVARKYDAAIETLSEAIRLDPSMVGARLFLGTAYLDTEQPDKALPHLEYAHKQKPTTESATTLGLAYSGLKQYDKAARYFKLGLEGSEQKDNQLYFIADSYLKLSERVANSLAEKNPDSKYDHLLAAKIVESQDRYQMAAREYLEAGKKDPFNAAIFFPLARMLAILGLDKPSGLALERYRQLMVVDQRATLDASKLPKGQAADVGPKTDYEGDLRALPPVDARNLPPLPLLNSDVNAELRKRLASDHAEKWKAGTEHLLHARWRQGIAALEGIPATDWLRDYLMATAYLWSDEYDKAEEILSHHALKSQTSPSVQMLDWGVNQQLSFLYFSRLLEEFPKSARAHFLKGRTLDAQSNKDAEAEYQAAIAADPAQTEARIALADFYLSNSKYQEALAECQKALEINSYFSPAKIRIGRIYIQLRDPQKGIPYVQSVLKTDPDDAQARADLARGFELLGEVDKAVTEYQRALKLDPSLTRIHYVLGRIYRKQGKAELADNEFRVFEQNEASERAKHLTVGKQLPENQADEPARPPH